MLFTEVRTPFSVPFCPPTDRRLCCHVCLPRRRQEVAISCLCRHPLCLEISGAKEMLIYVFRVNRGAEGQYYTSGNIPEALVSIVTVHLGLVAYTLSETIIAHKNVSGLENACYI